MREHCEEVRDDQKAHHSDPSSMRPVCVDRNGYIRQAHDTVGDDPRCVFCDKTLNQFGAFVRMKR